MSDMPPAEPGSHGLVVRGLHLSHGATRVLTDVSFTLPADARVGLVGANGAGKSALLRAVAGLTRPTSGTITLGDGAVPDGRSVAFVPQGRSGHPHVTADGMLALAASLDRRGWRAEVAERWLDAFAVPRGRRCSQLSGAERAHVFVALALGRATPLLVMDEPFADLDPLTRPRAVATLRNHLDDTGRLLLISSRRLTDLERLCDRLVVLRHGRVVLDASAAGLAVRYPEQDLHDVVTTAMRPAPRGLAS